jgi:predicted nuclease with TOPRIM domain
METVVADGVDRAGGRQRIVKGIEEVQSLLGLLPRFLEENERLQERFDATARACEKLREEVAVLRSENGQFRTERDQMVDTVSKAMSDMLQLSKELLEKLRAGSSKKGVL